MIRFTAIDMGDVTARAELIEFLIAHEYPNAPLFDLRLATEWRGVGLGSQVLLALATYVFTSMPAVNRLEGQTREDNIAMRKSFNRSGFVKEAHYREAWPTETGVLMASTAYGILRRDWQTGQTTTFEWNDLSGPRSS